MIVNNIADYILGETDELLTCIGEEDNQKVALAMIHQTDRYLDILSRYLDPAIYNHSDGQEAFEELALRSRHSRIRILLHEPRQVAHYGHSILELGKRLPSYIHFRKPSKKYRYLAETFMIADHIGVMRWPYPDSLKAMANFKDPLTAKELTKLFNEIWEDAELDPDACSFII